MENKLDLMRLHSRASIRLYDFFDTDKGSTLFLKDVAFNDGRTIKQHSCTGNQKTWVCAGKECEWFVKLTLKRPTKSAGTKAAAVPTRKWYVSALSLRHSSTCVCAASCTPRQMRELSGFEAALV